MAVICLLGIDVFAQEHIAGLDISYIQYLPESNKELEDETELITEIAEETVLEIETENLTDKVIQPTQESEWVYLGKFEITFYCSCSICTGNGKGITASGQPVQAHKTIAVDTSIIPFYTQVQIAGLDYTYEAHDTGGAIKGNRIDVYVVDHNTALQLGRWKQVNVWIKKGD